MVWERKRLTHPSLLLILEEGLSWRRKELISIKHLSHSMDVFGVENWEMRTRKGDTFIVILFGFLLHCGWRHLNEAVLM